MEIPSSNEARLFGLANKLRIERNHYRFECGVLRKELKDVRANYATLSEKKKETKQLELGEV